MATKKFIELQEFTDADLMSELEETEVAYQKMKFDHAVKGIEDPISLREVRKDIARLKTEARRRELAEAAPEELASRSNIRRRRRKK